MTPLGVSLTFIMISIIISVGKHFLFPSSSPTTNEESSIEMKKLYTITDKQPEKESKSYSSFYEAYHQFHLSQAEEKKHRIEENFMKQYNSLVMKKSIINDEFVILCEQNYLMTVGEGISCNHSQQCDWQTQFNVYELPLLKEETRQSISVQGKIGLSSKDQRGQMIRQNLKCKKIADSRRYFVTFPLAHKNSSLNQETWTLNKLTITKNSIDESDQRKIKAQKLKSTKPKKLQARRYEIFNNTQKKASNKSFELETQSFSLQQPTHKPHIFNCNQVTLSYSTQSSPWLIHYKTPHSQWQTLNILQKPIQNKVYQDLQYSSRIPPFDRKDLVEVKDLLVFESREDIYPVDCNDKEEGNDCDQRVRTRKSNYLTVVYLHQNNQYRVEKFCVQLTFEIGKRNQDGNQQNQYNQTQQQSLPSPHTKLTSYSLLVSQINPARQIRSVCSLHPKTQNIIQRHFDKFYWLYENKLISSLQTSSLLCVFRFQLDEHLKIVEISDLIHSTEKNRYADFAFLDWKSLNKILNYKENFQQETYIKNLQFSHQRAQAFTSNLTRNKTQPTQNSLSSGDAFKSTNSSRTKKSYNIEDDLDEYLEIFKQEFVQTSRKAESKDLKDKKQENDQKDNKKKAKKKRSETVKKQKSDKSNKKKKKSRIDSDLKANMTFTKGQHKPTIQTSFNYSFIRKTVFPHRSQVKKYKFPLPFLLSFTQNMQIVDPDPLKPMILFSGVKQYLFTYTHKPQTGQNSTLPNKVVDYRYLILGSTYKPTSKFFNSQEGTPQHEIQTIRGILQDIQSKSFDEKGKQKLTIEIKDQTHPEVENVIKTMYESDEQILNQVKSIKSIPVEIKRRYSSDTSDSQIQQTYQRYLIVVWGWGVQVYMVDWDKNGFLRENITQQEIEQQLAKNSSNLIEYFLPFIQLFATFYCMFQALVSSR